MLHPFQIATLIINTLLTVIGSVGNTFIVVVNGIDWVKTRHLDSIDIILTSLGAARFCFQWEIMVEKILLVVYPAFFTESANIFYSIWIFLQFASFWFACWLSVFYCAKIVNLSHPLFIFLKFKIPEILPRLLWGSVLVSLVTCFPLGWGQHMKCQSNLTITHASNNSIITNCMLALDLCQIYSYNFTNRSAPNVATGPCKHYIYLIPAFCLGYGLPFFIFCMAALLLIGSLWNHTRKMTGNMMGFRNPNLKAHFVAIKVMATFLLFGVFCFICVILDVLYLFPKESFWIHIVPVGTAAYSSLHSVILILSNSKLRQSFAKLLHHGMHSSGGVSQTYQLDI
ncbi:taste receptor type 2 member 9-like [Microcaecilia unicolor]|uniref:Taste receptor type 2 n=1 Tax=Microcaecilia unicolor TaxID=1415580 RepID=A0A6P7X3H3_9AMPH|nr:taste receptor type 2 member 9-like [Microcaecilia unicolor]